MADLLLEASLRAIALSSLVWCLLRLLNVRSPAQERIAWLLVLCVATFMPAIALLHRDVAVMSTALLVAVPAPISDAFDTARAAILSRYARRDDLLRALRVAYECAAAMLVARDIVSLVLAWRLWRDATPIVGLVAHGIPVRCSRRVRTPATVGRSVLLPADWTQWSQCALTSVLAHEASHVSRGDFFWLLLARLHCAVFWASPLSWWMLRRLTVLSEHLSDEAAVTTQRHASDYAALLLEFARVDRTGLLMVGLARRSLIATRIDWILRETTQTGTGPHRAEVFGGIVCATMLSIAVPNVTLRPIAVASAPKATTSAVATANRASAATDQRTIAPTTPLASVEDISARRTQLAPSATMLDVTLRPLATPLTRLSPLSPLR
jgi:beta-lactamase regulating signal transducer with metallopeptidase domain